METQKININAVPGVSEIIIREGKAIEPERERKPLVIIGTIDAPFRFLKNRISDLTEFLHNCNIAVDKEAGKIVLSLYETSELGDSVTGTIILDENIKAFGINNGKYMTPEDMSNFLRIRKHYFESEAEYSNIFTALRNFRAKVNQQVAAIKDDAGNYEQKKEQVVEHNIPKTFKLNMPVFKGMPKVLFEVEFLVNKTLDVTLYSAQLIQLEDELRNQYLSEVVEKIAEVAPEIVIINK